MTAPYQPSPPPTSRVQLTALRTLFPDYAFSVTSPGPGPRCYQARRIRGSGHLHAVATTSARDLWRILRTHSA
ncbi:MAG: hypothetical protein M3Z75_17905 [Actinomycetota bacterium]|nr:hypothetical protein [Actinomycetota bacterium]